MARKAAHRAAHFPEQPTSKQPSKQSGKPAGRSNRKNSKAPIVIILVLLLVALGVGGVMFWRHRPVSVTVNGQQRTVFKRSTYDQVFKSEQLDVQPGDLVSVSGNVLEENAGYPYSVTINGVELDSDTAGQQLVWGGENIVYGDGQNAFEPYTTEIEVMKPKLEYRIAPGTGEKGYMVQQGTVQYVAQWGKAGKQEVRHGERTGETAVGDVVEPAQNLIVVAQNIHPDNDQKLVALTFDDGPTYFTEPYLEILAEYNAKASFCVIGEQLADGGPVVAETAQAGHQILSHSWSHLQLTALDWDQTQHEIGDTAQELKEWLGYDVAYLRAPYGDMDERVWLNSNGYVSVSLFWTHDSEDWEKPGVDKIVENCTRFMAPGSVILMHDGGGDRNQDLEALPRIIAAWQEAGYTFVTIQELMESDSSINMSAVNVGPMPESADWPTEVA